MGSGYSVVFVCVEPGLPSLSRVYIEFKAKGSLESWVEVLSTAPSTRTLAIQSYTSGPWGSRTRIRKERIDEINWVFAKIRAPFWVP